MKLLNQTISSVEVSEMIEKAHKNLLRDISRYIKQMGEVNATSVNELKIEPVDFFEKGTYTDSKGESRICYRITKKGCEFIAHKLTGAKGTAFTARYINRFHEMEEAIKAKERATIPESPTPAAGKRKIPMTKWFFSNNWKCDAIMANFGWSRKYLYRKILVELSDLYNLRDVELAYKDFHGYRPEYKLDLLDFDERLANTATHYLNYLLVEEA